MSPLHKNEWTNHVLIPLFKIFEPPDDIKIVLPGFLRTFVTWKSFHTKKMKRLFFHCPLTNFAITFSIRNASRGNNKISRCIIYIEHGRTFQAKTEMYFFFDIPNCNFLLVRVYHFSHRNEHLRLHLCIHDVNIMSLNNVYLILPYGKIKYISTNHLIWNTLETCI